MVIVDLDVSLTIEPTTPTATAHPVLTLTSRKKEWTLGKIYTTRTSPISTGLPSSVKILRSVCMRGRGSSAQ